MTQAFNLAQLANKVNSSGQLDASTGLVNAVPVANGGLALSAIAAKSIPLANVANTYTTLTPGANQSIRINAGNTAWEAFTPGTGTVTSVATGNGLTGGTITGSGTISLDFYAGTTRNNTSYPIGSYVIASLQFTSVDMNANTTLYTQTSGANINEIANGTNVTFNSALAGAWKSRGSISYDSCVNPAKLSSAALYQRVS